MEKNEFEHAFSRNSKRLYLIAFSFTANRYDSEDILQTEKRKENQYVQ